MSSTWLNIFAVALCVTSVVGCDRTAPSGSARSPLSEAISRWASIGISGSLSVRDSTGKTFEEGLGAADRDGSVPNGPRSIFDIGSLAKTITAVTILRLQEEGVLDIDDRVEEYLAVPRDKSDMTLHHLLTHSSGLGAHIFRSDYEPVSRHRALRSILRSRLMFPAGRRSSYSNLGYTVLAAIVEKATGADFQTVVQREVLEPVGMTRTGWFDLDPAIGTAAHGYDGERDLGDALGLPGPYWTVMGNGGMVSSTHDLLRLFTGIDDGLLSPDSRAAMTAPHVRIGARTAEGYGCVVVESRHGTRCEAAGGNDTTRMEAAFSWDPGDRSLVVAASNDTRFLAGPWVRAIRGVMDGDDSSMPPSVAKVDDATLGSLEGMYQLHTDEIEVVAQDRNVVARPMGRAAFKMLLPAPVGFARDFAARERAVREFLHDIESSDGQRFPAIADWFSKAKATGPYRGYEIWGTTIVGPDPWTFIELRFGNATMLMRLAMTAQGGVEGVLLDAEAPDVLFVPTSSDSFERFALPMPEPVSLRFGMGEVEIVSAAGTRVASKI